MGFGTEERFLMELDKEYEWHHSSENYEYDEQELMFVPSCEQIMSDEDSDEHEEEYQREVRKVLFSDQY